MADFAPGLPDPRRFGRSEDIPSGKLLQYVVQRHLAERAGPHYDVRFGEGSPARADLYSWATKKELPQPGGKTMLFQQPLHRGQYAKFQGTLTSGYGKGTVKTHDSGTVVVTKADPNKISFIVAHKKYPEFFTMIRQSGPPKNPRSLRQAQSQGGSWLLVNTTPINAAKLLGGKPNEVGLNKLKFTRIPAEKVDKIFDGNYLVQEKIDGASALYHLLADRIEAVSYRVSKTGRPIVHTHRVFGPGGSKSGVKIPEEFQGSILRGEIYGQRAGKSIPPQELGGILNASVQRSVEKQRQQQVGMKNMLFDIVRLGKQPVPEGMPVEEKLEQLRQIAKHLPRGQFHLPETASDPEAARELWQRISTGQHPRTAEGVIAWPKIHGKRPLKVKVTPEADVWVQSMVPGEGRLAGKGAGGFEYSLSEKGPVVGRVGSGFTEDTRREMVEDPENWIGRMARIRSQGKFPSGAHRAPVFMARHEDYPMKTASLAQELKSRLVKTADNYGAAARLATDVVEETADQITRRAMAAGYIGHQDKDQFREAVRQKLRSQHKSMEGAEYQGTRPVGAPVSPFELGLTGGLGAALPYGFNRLGRALGGKTPPVSLARSAVQSFGPTFLPITAAFEGIQLGLNPLSDPRYKRGDIGYVKSLGEGVKGSIDTLAERGRQARKKYGLLGVPVQALHGILNPITSTAYLARSLKDSLMGKASEDAALNADNAITAALGIDSSGRSQ